VPSWLETLLNVLCGAWAGSLISALWFGQRELRRLREEIERERCGRYPDPEPPGQGQLWSGPEKR
jgi:hypothetical protein